MDSELQSSPFFFLFLKDGLLNWMWGETNDREELVAGFPIPIKRVDHPLGMDDD